EVMNYVARFYHREGAATVSIVSPPFFITNTVIGFFIDKRNPLSNRSVVDTNTVVVVDLTNGSCYLQDFEPSSSFPPKDAESKEFFKMEITTDQTNGKETLVTLVYKDSIVTGRLNTRTLKWSESKVDTRTEVFYKIVSFTDGSHIIAVSETREVGESRVIGEWKNGEEKINYAEMTRFRLVRHPLKVYSLLRLATIAVQRSGRVREEQMNQIAHQIG
ncbi:hypothetical protein PENTCL1PPCAC_22156, partial [Pristionchus entomophagus]